MRQHTRVFLEWKLVSLDYTPCFSDLSESPYLKKALTDHLPNVEWFCGVERLTYLSRAQELQLSRCDDFCDVVSTESTLEVVDISSPPFF